MKNSLPFVSLIIPCRNEEKYIGKCLESVINQTFPKEKVEILVIDGRSEDKTKTIVKEYIKKYSFIKLLDNPKKIFAPANNIGIKNSKGDIIMILGCHAIYPKDYIKKCVNYLKEYNVDNVGGELEPLPAKKTLVAKAIAFSLGGTFGKGRPGTKKAKEVDTVFGGCYKKEVFQKIGLFNEDLIMSSDMELNIRLKEKGGKILLFPDITVHYFPKDNLKDFFLHNIRDGIWAILPIKFIKRPLKLRHCIPLVFVLSLPLSIWLYIPVVIYISAKIALKEKDIRYFFIMPIVFAARHFGYGFGSLWGVIKLIF